MADLREWLAKVEEIGELKTIHEADPELEIGTLTEINDGKRGPALLFEKIKRPGFTGSIDFEDDDA